MKTRSILTLGFIATMGFMAATQARASDDAEKIAKDAREFVQKASQANLFEIETSKLALTRATDPEVKSFAQRMVDEHTSTGQKLSSILTSANVDPASVATTLNEKNEKKLEKLSKEDAKGFDKKYVSLQEDAHEDAIKLFKHYAKDGKDLPLKNFAAETLPALQSHKDAADVIKDKK